jgi:protocatechuate 3,4-dioxygenase beta subunit
MTRQYVSQLLFVMASSRTSSARPAEWRRVLRQYLLRNTLGRIDNRALIRDNAELRPHQATATESNGPYYIPGTPVRRDIREDRQGAPLTLRVRVVDVHTDEPLAGSVSGEIWHSDANGHYSGYLAYLPERIPAFLTMALRRFRPTDGSRFLRGRQYADPDGVIEFLTIVPGWYTPRTLHIHFKIRHHGKDLATTEFYLPEWVRRETLTVPPYDRRGPGMFVNANDAEIRLAKGAPGCWPQITGTPEGYQATITVKVDPRRTRR